MTSAEERTRGIETSLFAIPFFTYTYFYQGSDHSVACRFDQIRSILERNAVWIDDFSGYNTADIVGIHGHTFSVKAPGTSYTAIVQWKWVRFLLSHMPNSLFESLANHLHTGREPLYWAFATYLTTILSTSLIIALLCVVMFRFARVLGASEGRAAGLSLILGLGTIVFPYATELTGEPVAGACLFTALYLLATFDSNSSAWRALGAGFLTGWAVLNDYPVALVAVGIGLYALLHLIRLRETIAMLAFAVIALVGGAFLYESHHVLLALVPAAAGLFALMLAWLLLKNSEIIQLVAFTLGALVPAALMFHFNWLAFGNPLFFSYQAFKEVAGNNQFPEQRQGFVGLTYPKIVNLWNVVVDPQRGLLFCNPVLWLSFLGAGYWMRTGRTRAVCATTVYAFIIMILFNASYGESIVSWGGGTATGPRQIIAAVPFMVLPIAFLPAAYDYVIGALGVVSAAIMLMATSTNPHFPYEYGNPVRDFALQQFMRGDLGSNRDAFYGGGMVIRGDSVAFNLGKLAGLPEAIQLVPLGLWWCMGIFMLAEPLQLWAENAGGKLRAIAAVVATLAVFILPASYAIAQPTLLNRPYGLLGRYYSGEQCGGSRVHFARIDSTIDLDNIIAMGAMPTPSCAQWDGTLIAPVSGDYNFVMDVDDNGWLRIDGNSVIDTQPQGQERQYHGDGRMHLDAGPHRIEVGERNTGGDSSIHLRWAPPGLNPEIIPSTNLIPAKMM
ncbi:MAG TPA: PA14 domain-containing protein [Candidatus Binataceae bacterium]|nr:PA14 domain-containing protein [Candidatus Binataceae bacterium]